jgi:hypothetical protein
LEGGSALARPLPTHRTTQTKTNTDIHAPSEIRTHDPSIRASEDNSCLKPHGQCDRRILVNGFTKFEDYFLLFTCCVFFFGQLLILVYFFNGFSSPFRAVTSYPVLLLFFTDGRTPWTEDQPVARPLPEHRPTQTQNKLTNRHPCLEWVSKSRSRCSSERRQFMLQTPRLLWYANLVFTPII